MRMTRAWRALPFLTCDCLPPQRKIFFQRFIWNRKMDLWRNAEMSWLACAPKLVSCVACPIAQCGESRPTKGVSYGTERRALRLETATVRLFRSRRGLKEPNAALSRRQAD